MAVTFTQAEIDAFRAAMLANPGVTRLKIGDRETEFGSLKELREQLEYMERHLDTGANTTRTRYGATSKGTGGYGSWSNSRRYSNDC